MKMLRVGSSGCGYGFIHEIHQPVTDWDEKSTRRHTGPHTHLIDNQVGGGYRQ